MLICQTGSRLICSQCSLELFAGEAARLCIACGTRLGAGVGGTGPGTGLKTGPGTGLKTGPGAGGPGTGPGAGGPGTASGTGPGTGSATGPGAGSRSGPGAGKNAKWNKQATEGRFRRSLNRPRERGKEEEAQQRPLEPVVKGPPIVLEGDSAGKVETEISASGVTQDDQNASQNLDGLSSRPSDADEEWSGFHRMDLEDVTNFIMEEGRAFWAARSVVSDRVMEAEGSASGTGREQTTLLDGSVPQSVSSSAKMGEEPSLAVLSLFEEMSEEFSFITASPIATAAVDDDFPELQHGGRKVEELVSTLTSPKEAGGATSAIGIDNLSNGANNNWAPEWPSLDKPS
ncbi:hypothetical protein CBR_g4405 [Chara braunii]|uniref:Uncharacterized protein n=1 Tax=Chara braunii TaxID=69332 RepID=A0A388KHQ0_CHABU|nr:hypothetical protein CBR_g4405 [Chara braunii]|eukprot:GBG69572.1 hypothetical protein CBR_g4405 [Chara braunii]